MPSDKIVRSSAATSAPTNWKRGSLARSARFSAATGSLAGDLVSRPVTNQPWRSSSPARCEPMKPATPVISARFISLLMCSADRPHDRPLRESPTGAWNSHQVTFPAGLLVGYQPDFSLRVWTRKRPRPFSSSSGGTSSSSSRSTGGCGLPSQTSIARTTLPADKARETGWLEPVAQAAFRPLVTSSEMSSSAVSTSTGTPIPRAPGGRAGGRTVPRREAPRAPGNYVGTFGCPRRLPGLRPALLQKGDDPGRAGDWLVRSLRVPSDRCDGPPGPGWLLLSLWLTTVSSSP